MMQAIRQAGPFPLDPRLRSVIWELSKREVVGRYRGMNFGVLWSLFQPFLMLAVYTLAFGEILRARWPGADSTTSFALIIFIGLIVHGFLAECLSKAPLLVVGNANYVKRIVFPLEILPWPVLLSGLFHFLTNTLVLLGALVVIGKPIHATVLLLPAIMLPLCLVAMGSMWLVASLAVYFRDLNQLIGPLVTALFFLSSAIVPLDAVPGAFRTLFYLNPVTMIVDAARAVILAGAMPDWSGLGIYLAAAFAWMMFGYTVFTRLRKGFANVL
ncbi:MAG: ABC transporter permease [Rehaibacterium terrae]|uniref:ABC transporter permease n=1 Tax=Rehaibacterium terrae TaxID=1341696 RepID=UPI00391A0BF7